MFYRYNSKLYKDEMELDEAIVNNIGHKYNNIDPTTTAEFEEEFYTYVDREKWTMELHLEYAEQITNDLVEEALK